MMTAYQGNRFRGQEIRLDGGVYRHCEFVECVLLYGGSEQPTLEHNTFERCSWVFDREAGNTLVFLQALHHGGGAEFVQQVVKSITGES